MSEAIFKKSEMSVLGEMEIFLDSKIESLKNKGLASLIDRAANFVKTRMGTDFIQAKEYATDPDTTIEILEKLAKYPALKIREIVFEHENIDSQLIEKMYKDTSNTFITPLKFLSHHKITKEQIIKNMHSIPAIDMIELLDRDTEKIPYEVLKFIAFTGVANYWSKAEGSVMVDNIAEEIIQNKMNSLHEEDLSWELGYMAKNASCDLELYAVATHPEATEDIINICIGEMERVGIKKEHFISPETGKPFEYSIFAKTNLDMLDFSQEERPLPSASLGR